MTALLVIQAAVACLVLLVLGHLLVRAPRNVPLRAITGAIGSFSLTVVCDTAATHEIALLGLPPIMLRLIQFLGMAVGGYSLIAFYVFSALDRGAARRQAMWQAIPLVVTMVLLICAVALMPAGLRPAAAMVASAKPGSLPSGEMTVTLLYLTPNLYVDYALASAVLWTRRYARGAEPRLRRGLALASVGLAVVAAGETVFVITTAALGVGVGMPLWLFTLGLAAIMPGSVVFMAGVAYPAVSMRLAAARVWWLHRLAYHRLAPLWTLLHEHFPDNTFGRVPASRWRDVLNPRGVHRRYYRRVIECRDGLVRASPYLPQNRNGTSAPLADRLAAGLRARVNGATTPRRAVPVAIPATDDLDADVRELITLSDALRRSSG